MRQISTCSDFSPGVLKSSHRGTAISRSRSEGMAQTLAVSNCARHLCYLSSERDFVLEMSCSTDASEAFDLNPALPALFGTFAHTSEFPK